MTSPGRRPLPECLFDWRFDLIFGTAAIVMAVLYLLGVRRLRRRGGRVADGAHAGMDVRLRGTAVHDVRRDWAATCLRCFRCTWWRHMLLSMLVPILLVLGAPMTTCPSRAAGGGTGRAARASGMASGGVAFAGFAVLTNPIVATLVFVAGFYACTSAAFSTPR